MLRKCCDNSMAYIEELVQKHVTEELQVKGVTELTMMFDGETKPWDKNIGRLERYNIIE